MAAFADLTVQTWHPEPNRADSAGRPVGTRRQWPCEHTATLVEERDGQVLYGPEIPMCVYASEVTELPPAVEARLGMSRMHAWLFKANRVNDMVRLDGASVTFTALPHSQNRHFRTLLRPASHRPVETIQRGLLEAIESSADDLDPERRLQSALDGLTSTPFQSDPQSVSAWMVYPRRFAGLGAARSNRARDYAVGVCKDPNRCMEFLWIHQRVEWLFDRTDDDTLFDGLPDAAQRRGGPVARAVSDVARENKRVAMEMAITLAFAGPSEDSLYGKVEANARPVMLEVERIYRDILYRWSAYPPDLEPDGYLKNLREALARSDARQVIEGLGRQAETTPPGKGPLLNLIAACPPQWVLPPVLMSVLEKGFRHLSPESVAYRFARQRLVDRARRE
jgi:hypothetical protein